MAKKLTHLSSSKKRIAIKQAISTIKNKLKKLDRGSDDYIFCYKLLNKYEQQKGSQKWVC